MRPFARLRKITSETLIVVLQLVQRESKTAEWLFLQEKAAFRRSQDFM
jgi:hypothetical protein